MCLLSANNASWLLAVNESIPQLKQVPSLKSGVIQLTTAVSGGRPPEKFGTAQSSQHTEIKFEISRRLSSSAATWHAGTGCARTGEIDPFVSRFSLEKRELKKC